MEAGLGDALARDVLVADGVDRARRLKHAQLRAAIAQRWNKKPICHVHVLTV